MNSRPIRLVLLCTLLIPVLAACRKQEKTVAKKVEPAHVAGHLDESDLNTITLTEEAAGRLGIALAETKLVEVRRKRTVGGEVLLPPGKTIVVSAPFAGTLSSPADGDVPLPGQQVSAGQAIFRFTPMLSPERDVLTPAERIRVAQTRADVATIQIEAERQIESAKVAVEAAQIAFDRASQLLKIKAGSQRSVDEAKANLQLAIESQKTAEARHQFLSEIQLDEVAGQQVVLTVDSPVAGVLQRLETAVGETVSASEPLFSVITTDHVWIRVPVYVGQWRAIDTNQPALIAEFGEEPGVAPRPARYVSAPPTANPNATTVDVYYALDNKDGNLYPGQKLAVTIPLRSRAQSLVVPFKSVLYDIHGGAWVYEQVEQLVYARRRVSVEYVDDQLAVLVSGPAPGTQVVTDGAAELFGTEFGVGH